MTARDSGWRRVVLTVAMIAFALQSYVTQTHIHYASVQAFGLSSDDVFTPVTKAADNKAAPEKKSPANDDPANCPICQAVAHSGQFITPTAIGFALPSETIAFIPLAIAAVAARETFSHNWQGRAPPRH